jgi:hypothetical protein
VKGARLRWREPDFNIEHPSQTGRPPAVP